MKTPPQTRKLAIAAAIAVAACGITLIVVRGIQHISLPPGLDVASVDFSGAYTVQDIRGFNNRDSFTGMPLDQVDRVSDVTVVQGPRSIDIEYTDWRNRKRSDQIKRIGSLGARWVWTHQGLAGTGLPVRIFNLFMLPGLVYYDQSGSIEKTQSGLRLSYSWSEGGVIAWMIPWRDAPKQTTITLAKKED